MHLPILVKVSLMFIGLATAIGNGTVFLVYISNRSLHTLTNRFVFSLAISDFFVGTILLPVQVWSAKPEVLGPLIAFMLIASLSNISGCTYDRYIAILNPLRYHSILTPSKVRRIMILIWGIPIVVATIPQIWLRQPYSSKIDLVQKVYVGLMSFGVLITCVVLAGIYVRVFQVAKHHFDAIAGLESFAQPKGRPTKSGMKRRNSLKSLVKDVKATKLAAMIGAAFVLCWFPLVIINIVDSFGYSRKIPEDFAKAALFTIFANSLLNPVIYAFFQKDFKKTLHNLVRKTFRRRRSNESLVTSHRYEESTFIEGEQKKLATLREENRLLHTEGCAPDGSRRQSAVSFFAVAKETENL